MTVCVCVCVYDRQVLKVLAMHITECGIVTVTLRALTGLLRSRKWARSTTFLPHWDGGRSSLYMCWITCPKTIRHTYNNTIQLSQQICGSALLVWFCWSRAIPLLLTLSKLLKNRLFLGTLFRPIANHLTSTYEFFPVLCTFSVRHLAMLHSCPLHIFSCFFCPLALVTVDKNHLQSVKRYFIFYFSLCQFCL